MSQGHARHGGTGRRVAGAGRQRQQLEPALDGTVRPADQPVDNVDADADAPELGGRRAAVLLQHGRQADDGRGGRGQRRARCGRGGRWPVRGRFGHRVRHPLAVQVDGHVRMIAVVDLQRLAVEQFRTFSLVAQLSDARRRRTFSHPREAAVRTLLPRTTPTHQIFFILLITIFPFCRKHDSYYTIHTFFLQKSNDYVYAG